MPASDASPVLPPDQRVVAPSAPAQQRRAPFTAIGAWVARFLLFGVGVLVVARWSPLSRAADQATITTNEPLRQFLQDLVATGTDGLYRSALLGLTGLLAWWALPGSAAGPRAQTGRLLVLLAVVAALLSTRYAPPTLWWLLLSGGMAALWGFGFGHSLTKGVWAPSRWIAATLVVACALAAGLLFVLTDVAPAVADMPTVTDDDRERWRTLLKGADDEGPVQLVFSQDDLNLLTASWLSAQEVPLRADVGFSDDALLAQATLPLRIPSVGDRFVNATVSLRPTCTAGELRLGVQTLTLGGIGAPAVLVRRMSRALSDEINQDQNAARALQPIRRLEVAGQQLHVTAEPERVEQSLAEPLQTEAEGPPALPPVVRVYLRHLVDAVGDLPAGDNRFEGLLRQAFELAGRRSTSGTAVDENRAAIVALGILVGESRVRRIAGFAADERLPRFKDAQTRRVTLQGRHDLARHFFVSAALAVLAGQELSHAVGLLKEQLDAGEGGSGFSFADLAADLAGTQFANRATADPDTARALQRALAEAWTADDLMPSIDGLPEGLSEREFAEQYGSLADPRFLQVTVDIRQRLRHCRLLQEPPASPP